MFHGYNIILSANRLISTDDFWHVFFSACKIKFRGMYTVVEQNFGSGGIVILSLFALLLVLIIVIHIKSLFHLFKSEHSEPVATQEAAPEPEGLYYTIDEEPSLSANDNETATELYDEEEKERIADERALSAELIRISQETAAATDTKKQMQQDARKKQEFVQKNPPASTANIGDIPVGKVENLAAMVLIMLSRGVSEAKTIQALYYYYHNIFKEEDIFQFVRSIRDFIGLCNAGKFDLLPNQAELPLLDEAVLNLGRGNAAQCLVLLQALLNTQMDIAENQIGNLQDLNYAIAANYACLMGNIARINDIDLAHNSFELATELSPKSVRAWNRLGDMYLLENTPEKAFIAFQNVLDIGDPIMYAPQIADAQQYLSAYFEKSGLTEKAAELRDQSERFYEIYGVRTPLSQAERVVFQTLLNRSEENLPSSIGILLNRTR